MAVAAQNSVASLMRKTLDRQSAISQMKLKFKNTQIENVLVNYVRDGTVGPYNEVIRIIRDYTLNDDNFRVLLEDSMSCVVLLGKDLKQFVDVLLNVQWLYRDEELVALYSRFLLSLVTAHTYHCSRVMTSLVKLFKENGENWDVNPPDETIRLWSNIHSSIAQIVAVMPMTSNLLMQCLVEQFPYYSVGCFLNRAYIRNLIWISKYIPSLREQIMAVIVKNMVEMDGNMVEKSKKKSQNDDSVSAMEVDSEKHDGVSETLDYCMMEMLEWLEDERDPVLRTMCNIFERMILPTHGIKSVQFLILYTISINQQCADRVLNSLWVVASGIHGLGPGAVATRRTAVSHLAGLLARGVRVPNTRLVHYLRCMAEWCHSYITATQETFDASDNPKVHGAFHAICHAIFYLVAFKHQHLFASKENINFLESLNLPRLVTSALNPLRSCPPQVQRAFAAVTRAHQLVYCQAIIERNARHTLHSDAEMIYDEWYPYDPYVLPVSGKTIWPLCIEYKDWQQDGDDETQYTSMKRKLEPEDDDYLMPPAQRFAHSLSNCISPGFKNSESLVV